jgi:sulfite exporter TauE/SafE
MAGLAGSLHCIGMCGGLVTASTKTTSDVALYQVGRLLGYLILGVVMGSVGSLFKLNTIHPSLNYLPAFFIGAMFIVWGLASLWGKRLHLPLPRFLQKLYQRSWMNVVNLESSGLRSFSTGLITLFLPCGLLYGVILSSLALQSPLLSTLSMLFFWIGTLPSMMLAPKVVQKILTPLRTHRPKVYAISLMLLGVLTIGWRSTKIEKFVEEKPAQEKPSCH